MPASSLLALTMQGLTQIEIFQTEAEARAALYQAQSQNRTGYVLRYGTMFEVRHWPLQPAPEWWHTKTENLCG